MIPLDAPLAARWLAVTDLHVEQIEPRSLARVMHYYRLLCDAPDATTGPIAVFPDAHGRYAIADGHHRWMAHLLAGRAAIAVVIIPRGQP